MDVDSIQVQKHIKIDGDEHITHVFTFTRSIEVNEAMDHPAISALIKHKAKSNYFLLPSSCPKTIRLKIFTPQFS